MGNGAARHGSVLRSTELCRVMTHQTKYNPCYCRVSLFFIGFQTMCQKALGQQSSFRHCETVIFHRSCKRFDSFSRRLCITTGQFLSSFLASTCLVFTLYGHSFKCSETAPSASLENLQDSTGPKLVLNFHLLCETSHWVVLVLSTLQRRRRCHCSVTRPLVSKSIEQTCLK